MRLKVSSAKRWPFCLGLNVLMKWAPSPMLECCGMVTGAVVVCWNECVASVTNGEMPKMCANVIRSRGELKLVHIFWALYQCKGLFFRVWNFQISALIAWCKTAVIPMLMHWSYCSFALNYRDKIAIEVHCICRDLAANWNMFCRPGQPVWYCRPLYFECLACDSCKNAKMYASNVC